MFSARKHATSTIRANFWTTSCSPHQPSLPNAGQREYVSCQSACVFIIFLFFFYLFLFISSALFTFFRRVYLFMSVVACVCVCASVFLSVCVSLCQFTCSPNSTFILIYLGLQCTDKVWNADVVATLGGGVPWSCLYSSQQHCFRALHIGASGT